MNQVSARAISILEVCALPPIRKKKANGSGTELIQIHTARELIGDSSTRNFTHDAEHIFVGVLH